MASRTEVCSLKFGQQMNRWSIFHFWIMQKRTFPIRYTDTDTEDAFSWILYKRGFSVIHAKNTKEKVLGRETMPCNVFNFQLLHSFDLAFIERVQSNFFNRLRGRVALMCWWWQPRMPSCFKQTALNMLFAKKDRGFHQKRHIFDVFLFVLGEGV